MRLWIKKSINLYPIEEIDSLNQKRIKLKDGTIIELSQGDVAMFPPESLDYDEVKKFPPEKLVYRIFALKEIEVEVEELKAGQVFRMQSPIALAMPSPSGYMICEEVTKDAEKSTSIKTSPVSIVRDTRDELRLQDAPR